MTCPPKLANKTAQLCDCWPLAILAVCLPYL